MQVPQSKLIEERNKLPTYGSLFLVQARRKNSWGRWARQENPTATAFPTVSSWTCSTLSPPLTSCESTQFFEHSLLSFQAMWLSQPQPEPPLHAEGRTASCALDWKGDQWPSPVANEFQFLFQVKETYKISNSSLPSYISTLANPMRKRHKDDLLFAKSTVEHWKIFDLFSRMTFTMLGRRILLLSTSSLARTLSWVRMIF